MEDYPSAEHWTVINVAEKLVPVYNYTVNTTVIEVVEEPEVVFEPVIEPIVPFVPEVVEKTVP